MGPLLLILLLLVPIAELWVIVQVADQIGVVYTILLLLFVSFAGAWLLKQQGLATWDRMQASLRRNEMPTKEVTDGALILLGGALLLTPGFLTDVVGLILLFPLTRSAVKSAFRSMLSRRVKRRFVVTQTKSKTHEARVVKIERNIRTTRSSGPPSSSLPEPGRPDGEDDSPDRG
jgi:UPF0716 protein FxsA